MFWALSSGGKGNYVSLAMVEETSNKLPIIAFLA
jgi:hypothetical protein